MAADTSLTNEDLSPVRQGERNWNAFSLVIFAVPATFNARSVSNGSWAAPAAAAAVGGAAFGAASGGGGGR